MKKKNCNIFWLALSISFVIFVSYYIAFESGYYEVNISRKTIITEEGKREFEQDIKDGKEIDIKKYVNNDYVDYSSPFSRLGSNISNTVDKIMGGEVLDIFEDISKLFT